MTRLSERQVQALLAKMVAGYVEPSPARRRAAGKPRPLPPPKPLHEVLFGPVVPSFEFPAPLPTRDISQNGPRHEHGYHNKLVQEYREAVAVAAIAHAGPMGIPHFQQARLSLTFLVPDRRRRDVLNAAGAFKPGVDALVDVGLLPDDDHFHLQVGKVAMRCVRPGEEPCVLVRLDAVDESTMDWR